MCDALEQLRFEAFLSSLEEDDKKDTREVANLLGTKKKTFPQSHPEEKMLRLATQKQFACAASWGQHHMQINNNRECITREFLTWLKR